MNQRWENIVDYARGLGSQELRDQIEGDPEALAIAKQLEVVYRTGREQAPEMWVLRAKALMPKIPRERVPIWGRLLPNSGQLAQGFRLAQTTGQFLSYEFDGGKLEMRMEPGREPGTLQLVGVLESPDAENVRVGTDVEWLASCDEDGQFALDVEASIRTLVFENVSTQVLLKVELPNV